MVRKSADSECHGKGNPPCLCACLLYTSDAADERSSVDLGGRRIIKKKTKQYHVERDMQSEQEEE